MKNYTSWNQPYGVRNSQLSRIILPNITTIGSSFVWDGSSAGLKMIDIGPRCTSIGKNSFYPDGAVRNTVLVMRAITPPTYGDSSGYYSSPKIVFVPSGSLDAYKSAMNWSRYASKTYAIGGEEWIEQFGSSDEYANLTEQEYQDNYA